MSDLVRCGLCSAIIGDDRSRCGTCLLAWDGLPPQHDDPRFADIASRDRLALSRGEARFGGLRLGLATMRTLASRYDRTATPTGLARLLLGRVPSRFIGGKIQIADGTRPAPVRPDIALGCIARPGDVETLAAMIAVHGSYFAAVAIMIDGHRADGIAVRAALEAIGTGRPILVEGHPLDGDFGSQRNRLQAMAGTRWILHFDTDETPNPRLAANLPWIIDDADRQGDQIVGFPRLNRVDGALSAFYPDIQYRLVRSDRRFTGKVHETPLAGVNWRRVHRSLGGSIVHRLSGERVRARSIQYEALAPGAGKPDDERLLSQRWPMSEAALP